MQCQCFVELEEFCDLARYVCALREYPLRAYSLEFEGTKIISSTLTLANTLIVFYVPMMKTGRYISYNATMGKESSNIVNSTKDISIYAPIINFNSKISSLITKKENIPDTFNPISLNDLGSLARLTYDPENPEEQNLTLYSIPHKGSWFLGYITSLDMDDVYYQFNYVKLDSKPTKPFLRYQRNETDEPDFSDSFKHGFSYFPIVNVKVDYPVFGLN